MSVFDKWNKSIDVDGLAKDTKEAEANSNSGDYPEVPVGKYEVKIEKLELRESSKGDPMVTAWFRILKGNHANQLLFMNQVITQGFQIGQVNQFLRDIDVVDDVEFKDFNQYNDLIMDVFENLTEQGLEFLLDYRQNDKGFPIYKIKEVYEG